jgi:hypothetical protein
VASGWKLALTPVMLDQVRRRRFWIIAALVVVVAVVIGVLFGYLAGLAVVFGVITVGLFFLWGGQGMRGGPWDGAGGGGGGWAG